jgi:hypothetical protein
LSNAACSLIDMTRGTDVLLLASDVPRISVQTVHEYRRDSWEVHFGHVPAALRDLVRQSNLGISFEWCDPRIAYAWRRGRAKWAGSYRGLPVYLRCSTTTGGKFLRLTATMRLNTRRLTICKISSYAPRTCDKGSRVASRKMSRMPKNSARDFERPLSSLLSSF